MGREVSMSGKMIGLQQENHVTPVFIVRNVLMTKTPAKPIFAGKRIHGLMIGINIREG